MGSNLTNPDDVESHDDHEAAILEYLHAQAEAAQQQADALEDLRDLEEEENERNERFTGMLEGIIEQAGAAPGVDFDPSHD